MESEDVFDLLSLVIGAVFIGGGTAILIWSVSGLINDIEDMSPAAPWCSVVTTTGEMETQACPTGFNEGDRIYWDNEKKIYTKVG